MNNIQTPVILKKARESLGLSQASVSRDTGINRTYLSRFESAVQILSDSDLQSLQDHYANLGFDFSEIAGTENIDNELYGDGTQTVSRESCTIIDGFLIPEGTTPSKAEDLLDELKRHEEIIEAELSSAPNEGFFGIDEGDLRSRLGLIGLRGLRCYSIVQTLQGRENPFSTLTGDPDIDIRGDHKDLQGYLTQKEEQAQ